MTSLPLVPRRPDGRRTVWMIWLLLALVVSSVSIIRPAVADEPPRCPVQECPDPPPPVDAPPDPLGSYPLVVQDLALQGAAAQVGTLYLASDAPPAPHYWLWRIEPDCDVRGGDCVPGNFCAEQGGGVFMQIEVMPIAQPGPAPTAEAPTPEPVVEPPPAPGRAAPFREPPDGTPVGATYTTWLPANPGCVVIDALPLPPTPEEVYEVFTTLPIPELTLMHQPPEVGLVNLPEIFYTTDPDTATFTFDIRGYAVTLDTFVAQFRWYTGDLRGPTNIPVILTSEGPGLPYPNQYVTHTYLQRGTYTAALEAIWQATYSIDGGPDYASLGSVTTVGAEAVIQILEASPVLVDPYGD